MSRWDGLRWSLMLTVFASQMAWAGPAPAGGGQAPQVPAVSAPKAPGNEVFNMPGISPGAFTADPNLVNPNTDKGDSVIPAAADPRQGAPVPPAAQSTAPLQPSAGAVFGEPPVSTEAPAATASSTPAEKPAPPVANPPPASNK